MMRTLSNKRNSIWSNLFLFITTVALFSCISWHLCWIECKTSHETSRQFQDVTTMESNGLLYFLVMNACCNDTTDNHGPLFQRRLFSLACCLLTLAGVVTLGKMLNGSWRGGLIGVAYLASNLMFLSVAAHARFYALSLTFAIWGTVLLIIYCRRHKTWLWCLYTLTMIAMVMSMIADILLLPLHLTYTLLIAPSRQEKKYIILTFIIILAVAGALWLRDSAATSRMDGYHTFTFASTMRKILFNGINNDSFNAWMRNLQQSPDWHLGTRFSCSQIITTDARARCTALCTGLLIICSVIKAFQAIFLSFHRRQSKAQLRVNAIAIGFILTTAIIILEDCFGKGILTAYNIIVLLPIAAVLLGCTGFASRPLTIVFCLGYLMIPFHALWLTNAYVPEGSSNRTYALFWPRAQVFMLNYDETDINGSVDPFNSKQQIICADIESTFATANYITVSSPTLLAAYIRQATLSPRLRNSSIWVVRKSHPKAGSYDKAVFLHLQRESRFHLISDTHSPCCYFHL